MSSTLGVGVGKGVASGESRLRKLIQGKAESRLGHQARGLVKHDSRNATTLSGVSRRVEAVAMEGKALEEKKKSKNLVKRFSASQALRLATQANGGTRMSMRCYVTESGVPKTGEEASKASESPFGSVPRAASEQTVNAFRDNMKKEAGRLSMEPEEVIRVEGVEKSGAKLSTNKVDPRGSQSSNSGTTNGGNAVGNTEEAHFGRGKRATILVLLLAGVAAGLYSVGAIGGWIDEYKDEKEDERFLVPRERPGVSGKRNTSSSAPSAYSSSPSSQSDKDEVDWSNVSNFPRNVAISLSSLDDKVLDAAMSSDLVQSIREKLGYDPLNKDGSLKNQAKANYGGNSTNTMATLSSSSHSSPSSSSSDKIDLSRAAVVSEAIKDVSSYGDASPKEVEATVPSSIASLAPSSSDASSSTSSSSTRTSTLASTSPTSEPAIIPVAAVVETVVIPVLSASDASPSSSTPSLSEAESSKIASSTQFNESYDVSTLSGTAGSSSEPTLILAPVSSSSSDEVLQLLSIENEEMRQVIVKLMVELEAMKLSAEKLILSSTEGHARELQLLRQDEAKRVMEILRAYENKLAEELAHAQSIAAEEKDALKTQFAEIVNTTLASLRNSYEENLAANARSLEAFAEKWSTDLLNGPVREVATKLSNDAHNRLALTLSIKESLADTHAATLQYYKIAKESAAYARVARQWIILQDRVSKFPGAPFYPQLSAYLNACKEVPQLSTIVESIQSGTGPNGSNGSNGSKSGSSSSGSTSPSSLVRLSQIGSPTLNQLKTEFAEASKAARTSVLAPEGANAFQHGLASLREAFRSSAPAAVTTIATTVEKGVSTGVSAVLDASGTSSSSSSSSAASSSSSSAASSSSSVEDIAEKNWHTLQKAENLLQHDALGPALETLQALDGVPASLMKPWIERAQQTYFVSSTLDYFAFQTANLDFTAPTAPPSSPIAPSSTPSL